MRCRGYGAPGKRTSFQIYRFTGARPVYHGLILAALAAAIMLPPAARPGGVYPGNSHCEVAGFGLFWACVLRPHFY